MAPEMSSSCNVESRDDWKGEGQTMVRDSEDRDARPDFEPEFYLITFSSASHCIETEKKARKDFKVHIIPTPREITASCGMALKFTEVDLQPVKDFFLGMDVPSKFFAMGSRMDDGKRPVLLIDERTE